MQSAPLQLRKVRLNQAREHLLAFQEEKIEVSEDMKPIVIAEKYLKAERKLPVSIQDLIMGPNSYYTADLTIHGSNSEGNAQPFKFTLRSKYFPKRQDGTIAMLTLRYLRTNQNNIVPDIIISFGTSPLHYNTMEFLTNTVGVPPANITGFGFIATACNAPGILNYQLHIPAIELFNGSLGGAINGFYLDL
ncbi:495_t:CDS:2 [Diversispora eburnea]|uniref:495_t:CDS:1 n=1 Tax=Diversispora eburnea TaxID=1213867 RepID=A0A9N8YHT7_9GLOM|nr:495_t:CDS:2 [Diversispora eburnea]